jgi:integrase
MPVIKSPVYRENRIVTPAKMAELLASADKVHKPDRMCCLLALVWIFAKRIGEILRLQKEDFTFGKEFLYVKFLLEKKRVKEGEQLPYQDMPVRLDHPLVQRFILPYIQKIEKGYIFRSHSTDRIKRTIDDHGYGKVREYEVKGGYLTASRATQMLKELDRNMYWHWFRHSVATTLTYPEDRGGMGADVLELMEFLGHSDPKQSIIYVRQSGQKTMAIAEKRTW